MPQESEQLLYPYRRNIACLGAHTHKMSRKIDIYNELTSSRNIDIVQMNASLIDSQHLIEEPEQTEHEA